MNSCLIIDLGLIGFADAFALQKRLVAARKTDAIGDVLLLCEHPHVITLGRNGSREHLLASERVLQQKGVEFHATNRGGDITYHGPGQLVAYTLFDLRRSRVGVRAMVRSIEGAVIEWLRTLGISAYGKPSAPGVYVAVMNVEAKIAALGLKVRNGCTYHGLAVNIAMDLTPFADIDPCGYPGLAVTQLVDLGVARTVATTGTELAPILAAHLRRP